MMNEEEKISLDKELDKIEPAIDGRILREDGKMDWGTMATLVLLANWTGEPGFQFSRDEFIEACKQLDLPGGELFAWVSAGENTIRLAIYEEKK